MELGTYCSHIIRYLLQRSVVSDVSKWHGLRHKFRVEACQKQSWHFAQARTHTHTHARTHALRTHTGCPRRETQAYAGEYPQFIDHAARAARRRPHRIFGDQVMAAHSSPG